MNLEPQLPDPLRYKISSWELPLEIELALLTAIQQMLRDFAPSHQTKVKTMEFSVGDFRFYGYVAGRIHHNAFVLTDLDFEVIPPFLTEVDPPDET